MPNYYSWNYTSVVPGNMISGGHWGEIATNMSRIRGYLVDFGVAYSGGSTTLGASGPYNYTLDSNLGVTHTPVRGDHVNSLRDALDNINSVWAAYKGGWSWCRQYSNNDVALTDNRVTVNVIKIRAVHVNELKAQLDLVDASMYSSSPFCPVSCQIGCQLACQGACQYACQQCNNSTCHDQMCGWW